MFLINQLHVSNLIEFVSLEVAILEGGSKTCRTCIQLKLHWPGLPYVYICRTNTRCFWKRNNSGTI
jgi:hypothetical protein